MKFEEWVLDKRVIERNIRRKMLTRDDYVQYLASLPDVSDLIADPDEDEEEEEAKGEEDETKEASESGDA